MFKMKVNIGNYRRRWTSQIHYDYMNKKYDSEWETNTNRFETALQKLEEAVQYLYDTTINASIERMPDQKINVRIDSYDTWSMDHTLSHIILPMLVQLKADKHGSPFVDDDDVPAELRSTVAEPKVNKYDTDSNHHLRWDWVIGEMIWAFEQKCRDDWASDYYKYEDDPTNTDAPALGLKLVWEDRDGQAVHGKRMANGFRMFGKYYEGLWN
jgi:hypothetical protein